MKRRKFLVGVAGAGASVAAGSVATAGILGSQYLGKPAYLRAIDEQSENVLRLSLSRAAVPVDFWDDLVRYHRVWRALASDPASAAAFNADPGAWLDKNGLPSSVLEQQDIEFRLLRAVYSHPNKASIAQDYRSFIEYLGSQGIIDESAPQKMSRRLRSLIGQNRDQIGLILSRSNIPRDLNLDSNEPLLEIDKMVAEIDNLSAATKSTLMGVVVVPVAIAAIVVTYVSIATNVTVFIMLGFSVSIAVAVAVAVDGSDDTLQLAELKNPALKDPLMRKLIALDDESKQVLVNTMRSAYAVDRPDFALLAMKEFIATEIREVLEACDEAGLVQLPKDSSRRERYLSLSADVASKMLNLDAVPPQGAI